MRHNPLISLALGVALALTAGIGAQQSGSGLPGGATNSTQIRLNGTSFGGVGPGTSGQCLTSNGAGSPPSFQACGGGGGGPSLSGNNTFTSAGSATAAPVLLSSAGPKLFMNATGQGADERLWRSYVQGGSFIRDVAADNGTQQQVFEEITRSPTGIDQMSWTVESLLALNGGANSIVIDSSTGTTVTGDLTITGSCTGCGGGGGGSPGGASGDVQYNDGSMGFAGESTFNYDATDNQLLLGNGTGFKPAYSFTADDTMGIYSDGGSQMNIGRGGFSYLDINWGTQQMRFANTNVLSYFNGSQFDLRMGGGADELVVTSSSLTVGQILNISASTTSRASMNVAPGTAPTSPNNGDIWTTSDGVFARINGVTLPIAQTGTGTLSYADACSTTPTQTYSWVKNGPQVTLTFTQNVSCTSDSQNFISDALPTDIRPARQQAFFAQIGTSSVSQGCLRILTDGTIHVALASAGTLGLQCTIGANDGWTASGNKNFYPLVGTSPFVGLGPSFTYSIQ